MASIFRACQLLRGTSSGKIVLTRGMMTFPSPMLELVHMNLKLGFRATGYNGVAQNFNMPAMSPTMTEGTITSWRVKEGIVKYGLVKR